MNPPAAESSVMGVSIRAWIACALMGTVCFIYVVDALSSAWLNLHGADIKQTIQEPLYSLSLMAVTYYFSKEKSTGKSTNDSSETTIINK
jgi:hypothetical protein